MEQKVELTSEEHEFERQLADLLFGREPLKTLQQSKEAHFTVTDQKQFGLFHARLIKRVEERLSQQFGACLGLIEEKLSIGSAMVAREFACATEYRGVSENLTAATQISPARFEIAFLDFIQRTQGDNAVFFAEFTEIFLRELALDG